MSTTRVRTPKLNPIAAAIAGSALLVGCGSGGGDGGGPVLPPADVLNVQPAYVRSVTQVSYDGATDDLLTAGLGKTGLGSATPPAFADPLAPTAAELRRSAIYNNYRALLDMTAAGGYGTLYGPNVDAAGSVTAAEGKIAGTETIAYSDDGSGSRNVTLMVQIPASFDTANPCIVTATASGSRGVYGGITTGEWGLKKGCAVAYTDKGTASAPHDLQADTVALIDGRRTTSAAAGTEAVFRAPLTPTELAAFKAAAPNRLAFKHAHSQQNPERDWGTFTLQAIEFALYAINQQYGATNAAGARLATFVPANTLVIASSLSNGGGAAIAAAELDTGGLIDGVAVSEPAVELPANLGVTVQRGGVAQAAAGKTLFDYTSHANLYQSCASLSSRLAGAPFQANYIALYGPPTTNPVAANRCASLNAKGLLTATSTAAQADEALQRLLDYGWEPESSALHPSLAAFEVAPAVSITFANALSRSSVADRLCGYSFAATATASTTTTTGTVAPVNPVLLAQSFSTGNGIPPTNDIQLINDLNPSGPLRDIPSVSPSTNVADWNLDGALCLRNLLTGTDAAAVRLRTGIDETRRNGNLRGKPALIVHGRADALLPVSHTSRPYYALNKLAEGSASRLSYIEVTNAQHFDAFIGFSSPGLLAGYDTAYIPLHVYLNRALDAVYANLKSGTALPGSQVLRTVPRGGAPGAAPAITAANVPPFAATPAAANAIGFSGSTVSIPD